MTEMVPSQNIFKEKSILVLGNSKMFNISPWIKFSLIGKNNPLTLKIYKNGPRGFKLWKIMILVLGLLKLFKFDPYGIFGKIT